MCGLRWVELTIISINIGGIPVYVKGDTWRTSNFYHYTDITGQSGNVVTYGNRESLATISYTTSWVLVGKFNLVIGDYYGVNYNTLDYVNWYKNGSSTGMASVFLNKSGDTGSQMGILMTSDIESIYIEYIPD